MHNRRCAVSSHGRDWLIACEATPKCRVSWTNEFVTCEEALGVSCLDDPTRAASVAVAVGLTGCRVPCGRASGAAVGDAKRNGTLYQIEFST